MTIKIPENDLPDPLVPAEVDLNGYAFMPMLHTRVLQSTLFVKSTGDEFKAAFALWCASWSEVPAGSLPDDFEMLASLSRSKVWKKVCNKALHGWIKCKDGRLYHKTLAPLAIKAWEKREEFIEVKENKESRQERWRKKVKELSNQLRELGINPPYGSSLEKLETLLRDAQSSTQETTTVSPETSHETACRRLHETALRETVRGTVRGTVNPPQPPFTVDAQPAPPADPDPASVSPTLAGKVCRFLMNAGISGVNPSNLMLRTLLEAGATPEEFVAFAEQAKGKRNGFAYVLSAVKGQRTEAKVAANGLHQGPLPRQETAGQRANRMRVEAGAPGLAARNHDTATPAVPPPPMEIIDVATRTVD